MPEMQCLSGRRQTAVVFDIDAVCCVLKCRGCQRLYVVIAAMREEDG